jgi:hypothetical protein
MPLMQLEELCIRLAEHLPKLWMLDNHGGVMSVLTRQDSMFRIIASRPTRLSTHFFVEVAVGGMPLPEWGQASTSRPQVKQFKTKLNDPQKIADVLIKQLNLA